MGTNFSRLHPHSSPHWCSKTDCRIAIPVLEDKMAVILLQNLVGFDQVTPEIPTLEFVTFGTTCKNWHIRLLNITESTEPILTKFSDLVDMWLEINNLISRSVVAQGTINYGGDSAILPSTLYISKLNLAVPNMLVFNAMPGGLYATLFQAFAAGP